MWGGASLPAQELTHLSLYNTITHKRLSPCHIFSGSLDADSIYMALNKTCPRFHFHTGNNETPITLSGITVYKRPAKTTRLSQSATLQSTGNISAKVSENKNKAGHSSTRGTVSSLLFFPLKVLLHTVYIFNIFMWTEVIDSRRL